MAGVNAGGRATAPSGPPGVRRLFGRVRPRGAVTGRLLLSPETAVRNRSKGHEESRASSRHGGPSPMSVDVEPVSSAAYVGHVAMTVGRRKTDPHATRWGKFLQAAIKLAASDLIMKSDQVPRLRLRGSLKALDCEPVSAEEFFMIAKAILTEEQFEDLHKFGSVDFAYDYDEGNRFRVNLFQARGKLSAACRLITSNIRRFEQLYLPPIMSEIAMQPNGIVLLS